MDETIRSDNGHPQPAPKAKKVTPKSVAEAEIRSLMKEAQKRLDEAKSARAEAETTVRVAMKEIAELKDRLLELLSN